MRNTGGGTLFDVSVRMGTTPKSSQGGTRRIPGRRLVTTVHSRGGAGLDGMLDLTERASRDAPVDEILASLASGIAALLRYDVCSIYLPEDDSQDLVLRATHGFPQDAVGSVRMRVGEGLTGFAVECLRPVSVAAAAADARTKHFDALPEELYPALCALPLVDRGRAVGALVVQRREKRAFSEREVVLIAAMAPVVLLAVERARARRREEQLSVAPSSAPAGRRPTEMVLRGVAGTPGRGLGVVCVRRVPVHATRERAADVRAERVRLEQVLAEVAAEAAALDGWVHARLVDREDGSMRELRGQLLALRFVLDDDRLRERAYGHVDAGATAASAIERVAREYARVLGGSDHPSLHARGIELEGLCGRMLARLAGDSHSLVSSGASSSLADQPGAILVAGRVTLFEVIELARHHGSGIALAGHAHASTGLVAARALGLPVVCDVRSLYRWASEGDRALVDGDTGVVVLNPSRTDVAAHRRDRK